MELRVLRYFLAVAREETISGAADILHVSQPTLSRQLIEMENDLGKKLFIRGNRKITLTEEGLFLRKRAQEIVDLVDKTESDFKQEDDIVEGDIYIGSGETKIMKLIANVAHKMQQEYPGIRYHLYSGNADDVIDKLDKGLLDFGVLIEPSDVSKYDFLPIPAKDIWGLLMRKDSALAKKDTIRSSDLADIPIIISRQSFVDDVLSKWASKNFQNLNIVATYNLIFNASLLVEQGMGYALALDKLVNTSGESDLCFKPLYPQLEAKMDIVWKKNQVFSRVSNKFIHMLQKEFTIKNE